MTKMYNVHIIDQSYAHQILLQLIIRSQILTKCNYKNTATYQHVIMTITIFVVMHRYYGDLVLSWRTINPCLSSHLKYSLPFTVPLFLPSMVTISYSNSIPIASSPVGSSNATPIHLPLANSVDPIYLISPDCLRFEVSTMTCCPLKKGNCLFSNDDGSDFLLA